MNRTEAEAAALADPDGVAVKLQGETIDFIDWLIDNDCEDSNEGIIDAVNAAYSAGGWLVLI